MMESLLLIQQYSFARHLRQMSCNHPFLPPPSPQGHCYLIFRFSSQFSSTFLLAFPRVAKGRRFFGKFPTGSPKRVAFRSMSLSSCSQHKFQSAKQNKKIQRSEHCSCCNHLGNLISFEREALFATKPTVFNLS